MRFTMPPVPCVNALMPEAAEHAIPMAEMTCVFGSFITMPVAIADAVLRVTHVAVCTGLADPGRIEE